MKIDKLQKLNKKLSVAINAFDEQSKKTTWCPNIIKSLRGEIKSLSVQIHELGNSF